MAALPEPWKSLRAKLEAIAERVRKLENRSPFFGTGMHANGSGGIDSDNFVTGTSGYSFKSDGNAEFNDLTLRGGIIGNDALTNPVIPQSVWKGTTSNFGLAVAWSTLVTQNLTVPSGVTSVQIIGFVRLVATNTTASKDYLYSDFDIAGQSSGGFATPVEAGDPGTSFCSFARTLTGLTPGSTVTLTASGSTGFASWSSTDNVCQISASVTWYR